jgi:hypothetical protein
MGQKSPIARFKGFQQQVLAILDRPSNGLKRILIENDSL